MDLNLAAFAIQLLVSAGIATWVYRLTRGDLHEVLTEVVGLPAATIFFKRIFFLGLLFVALSSALNTTFDLKEDAAFMEYVWKVAYSLSSVFAFTCLFMTAYLVLVTILIAVLRRRDD